MATDDHMVTISLVLTRFEKKNKKLEKKIN